MKILYRLFIAHNIKRLSSYW